MIIGIGVDSVDIERCSKWHTFSQERLFKCFTADEIAYCMQEPIKSAERFASRFAAKEAFYKAFTPLNSAGLVLVQVAPFVEVVHAPMGQPMVYIDWESLGVDYDRADRLDAHISITHTRIVATAVVLLEQKG